MAESKRKPQHAPVKVTDDEAQARRDRITMVIILATFVLIAAGMWLLAGFLSGN